MRSDAGLWLRVFCVALALGGCTPIGERTDVQLSIDADPVLRGRITQVEVQLFLGAAVNGSTPTRTERLTATAERWPLGLLVARGEGADARYQLSALARDAGQHVIAVARAQSAFVSGRSLMLGLRFDAECADREQDCPGQTSCQQGVCTSAFVPPESLPGGAVETAARPAADGGVPLAAADGGCQGARCPAAQSCAMDNGGCDALRACSGGSGAAECGPCPVGYVSESDRSCAPALLSLAVEGALLSPAFSPERSSYALRVPLRSERLSLVPGVTGGVRLQLDGKDVASGERWTTAAPGLGEQRALRLQLTADGHGERELQLTVSRAGEIVSYLKADNAGAGDELGRVIAASGDTLVVGAPFEDGSVRSSARAPDDATKDAGAVYVFVRDGSGMWRQEAYLKAEAPREGAQFGFSVAIAGERMAAGAPGDGSGVVHVFERQNGAWPRVKTLRPDTEGGAGQRFGQALALRGEVLAVGAISEATVAADSGAVYVFERGGGDYARVQKLKSKTPGSLDWLGTSIALGEDLLVTSATGELRADVAGGGGVHLYARGPEGWQQTQSLPPADPTACGFFGQVLALSGSTLATTCWNASVERPAGAVYLYERAPDGSFQPGSVLSAGAAQSGDLFGHAIAFDGDDLLVGAPGERSAARGVGGRETGTVDASGAAYLFKRQGGGWHEVTRIKAPEPAAKEGFGSALALGGADLLFVAASQDASGGHGVNAMQGERTAPASGAVHVFR